MKRLLWVFLSVFCIVTAIFYIDIQLDLKTNPWLLHTLPKAAQAWKWYDYFPPNHGIAAIYLNGWLWLIFPLIFSTIITFVIWFVARDK
jgi:hypothetical protein